MIQAVLAVCASILLLNMGVGLLLYREFNVREILANEDCHITAADEFIIVMCIAPTIVILALLVFIWYIWVMVTNTK